MSLLRDRLSEKKTVITAEISPPKGAGIKKLREHIQLVSPHVTAINITDCQRSIVRMASWAACKIIMDLGAEPVLQVTCRDRNSIALQADLMGASALGIPNVLCLTGDPVKVGDSPDSRSVFEFESVKLLQTASNLQKGRDAQNLKMNAPTRFFLGSVVNPTIKGGLGQLERMKKKIAAGACFFQTQANYDFEDFCSFLRLANDLEKPILAGILVLHTPDIARFINENIPGIQLPHSIIERLENAPDPEKEGIELAIHSMMQLKDYCAGFHIMTIRREPLIPLVVKGFYERLSL
ncbi:MAG: methylenetetrahydrofolate reductase [Proteobacteria bacterium]|nr:methylenetetrahydrofolate reductase [Pseudomonadota bacterium]